MDDAFRNPFMVEMEDLLPQDEIFQQRWPTSAGLQAVLVVGDADTLVGRQVISIMGSFRANSLMSLAAIAVVGFVMGLRCRGRLLALSGLKA
jgi:hypothetical protein